MKLDTGILVVATLGGDLGQQGIVVWADDQTRVSTLVDTNTHTFTDEVELKAASVRGKVEVWVLRRHTALNGATRHANGGLLKAKVRQRVALRDTELRLDDVDTCDFFGDRVLDLETSIHFDEVVMSLLVHKELTGSGILILGSLREANSIATDGFSHFVCDQRSRCHLDDFLVTSLDGTVTLEQVDNVPVFVTDDLHLNVPWVLNELLEEHTTVPKSRSRLRGSSDETFRQLILVPAQTHSTTSSAERGLSHDRVTDFIGELQSFFHIANNPIASRNDRNVGFVSEISSGGLATHLIDDLARWADENDTRLLTSCCEVSTLRQKPVSRVNSVDLVIKSNLNELVDVQVRFHRS
mmetsp:Transcript_38226/g.74046  ORF Transcript_38226/g.74046 Transcript_38226/m.74046 type:complete len:354 (+) Transcript_38226:2589-3650(+)